MYHKYRQFTVGLMSTIFSVFFDFHIYPSKITKRGKIEPSVDRYFFCTARAADETWGIDPKNTEDKRKKLMCSCASVKPQATLLIAYMYTVSY